MRWRLPFAFLALSVLARAGEPLPGTDPLPDDMYPPERSAAMVSGIGTWLHREADRALVERHERWAAAARGDSWEKFAVDKRKALATILGLEAKRSPAALTVSDLGEARWTVLDGVYGEGLLFKYAAHPVATVIVVPDADTPPERSELATRLAQLGCRVLVMTTVSRGSEFAGNEAVRFTKQTNREWIYRQAFEMGRTLIGYEVQKVLAAVDALGGAVAVAGEGEGGLVALRAAALDPRLKGAFISGSFEAHAAYETEPIDRNLFGAWRDFGEAELAGLVAPRPVIVEPGRPLLIPGASDATRATIGPEVATANTYRVRTPVVLARDGARAFVQAIAEGKWQPWPSPSVASVDEAAIRERQRRTVRELERFTQHLVVEAERVRQAQVWAKVGTPEWEPARQALQERLWASIGKLPPARVPAHPQSRQHMDTPKWTGYEVQLDVLADVFAYGWLLVPKDLKPGERRPVVVCQHGLEGLPGDTVTSDETQQPFKYYAGFASRLADEGYIVYAPHNPYRGEDVFRTLQRQANPLGLSLFSFIIPQHEVTTAWLAGLPFVDPQRIGFYGLSYGGKTAMRVPALVDRYALSICSGDFNEWIRKNVSIEDGNSYMYAKEYEIFEWNLAWNANYAEMAMLIAPRPFMVERGHQDGVGVDEWVAYEFAKVKRGYLRLGIPDRAAIEWFDGPHTIHGQGTFEFLHQHLGRPHR